MYSDVHMPYHICLMCATYQGTGWRVKPQLMSIPVGGPFHQVWVNTMELPLARNGNKHICRLPDQN